MNCPNCDQELEEEQSVNLRTNEVEFYLICSRCGYESQISYNKRKRFDPEGEYE